MLILKIIAWLVLYTATWLITYRLTHRDGGYHVKPLLITVYFISVIGVHYLVFYKIIEEYINLDRALISFIIIAITILINLCLYRVFAKFFNKNTAHGKGATGLWPKSFEILFQQISFLVLFTIIQNSVPAPKNILTTAAIFFIMHMPLYWLITKQWATYYLLSSLFGGLIFAYSLSVFTYGFELNYIIHTIFYTITVGYLWKSTGNMPTMR